MRRVSDAVGEEARSNLGKAYFEPAQAASVVLQLGLVFDDAEALEVHEEVVPVGFMWGDVEDEEIEHCDESEAFVELGEGFQDP